MHRDRTTLMSTSGVSGSEQRRDTRVLRRSHLISQRFAVAVLVVSAGSLGCNAITGYEDLEVVDCVKNCTQSGQNSSVDTTSPAGPGTARVLAIATVEPAELVFDTARCGEGLVEPRQLIIKNTSDAPLTFRANLVGGEQSPFALENPQALIEPGSSVGMRVSAWKLPVDIDPKVPRTDTIRLALVTDHEEQVDVPVSRVVSGPHIVTDVSALDFKDFVLGASNEASMTVTNDGTAPVDVNLSVAAVSPLPTEAAFKLVSPASLSLAAGASSTVSVGFSAEHLGEVQGELRLATSSSTCSGPIARALKGRRYESATANIVSGVDTTCIIVGDKRRVACWGENDGGELGRSLVLRTTFAPVLVPNLEGVTQLSSRYGHVCALVGKSGYCWGSNGFGELGDGTKANSPIPVKTFGAASFTQIAPGTNLTCALSEDRTVRCLGDNAFGQLGDGTKVSRITPAPVQQLTEVVSVAPGYSHVCALRSSGQVLCWGDNEYGQMGQGPGAESLVPVAVPLPRPATSLVSGRRASCAILDSGQVACWGDNRYGQVGAPVDPNVSWAPVTIVPKLENVSAIALGFYHGCALRNSVPVCWGDNDYGQLGDGTLIGRHQPVLPKVSGPVLSIAAGQYHTCAVRTDGKVECWGRNDRSQAGVAGVRAVAVPTGLSAF